MATAFTGCAQPVQEQRIVSALGLHTPDRGLSYRTPRGCRIERLIVGVPDIKLYWVDDHHSLYANPGGTLGVKAVGLRPACKAAVRAGLASLR